MTTPAIPEDQLQWHSWEEQQTSEEGVYFWRVKSLTIPGGIVTFAARLGSVNGVAAPPFFKWNGWAPVVPSCEWTGPVEPSKTRLKGVYGNVSIVGLNFARCPFCKEVPTLRGMRSGNYGGVVIAADPHEYNCWWLECCQWGKTPSYKDPRRLEEVRSQAFNRIKTGEI